MAEETRQNGIIKKIDVALGDGETPRWAIPILLCVRDDHTRLSDHLADHRAWAAPVRQVFVSVVTALVEGAAMWFCVARFG